MPVVNTIVGYDNHDWYDLLVEDCKAIITEAVFISRWAKVEGYHQLGERIVTETNLARKEVYGKKILSGLSKSIGVGERTLYRAVQFYDKYPRLDTLPDGKNISWNKIITQYLPAGDGDDKPAWEYRWDSMKRIAGQLVDDTDCPEVVSMIARNVLAISVTTTD